jgi:hypothetical protein
MDFPSEKNRFRERFIDFGPNDLFYLSVVCTMENCSKPVSVLRTGVSWRSLAASTAVICVLGLALPPAPDGSLFGGSQALAQADCCFTARTPILMADGSTRAISDIRPGDMVMGRGGRINRVTGIHIVPLAGRLLHGINGQKPFFTAEHPFLAEDGWSAVDPLATWREMPGLQVAELHLGACLTTAEVVSGGAAGQLALAPAVRFGTIILHRIVTCPGNATQMVYNLGLDGDHSYVANGFVVHNKGGGGEGEGGGGGGGPGGGGVGGGGAGGGGGGGGTGGGGGGGGSTGGGGGGGSSTGAGTSGGLGSQPVTGESPPAGSVGKAVAPVVSQGGVSTPAPAKGADPQEFAGDSTPVGPDLTLTEEELVIKNGWQ